MQSSPVMSFHFTHHSSLCLFFFLSLLLLRTAVSFEVDNMLSEKVGAGEVRFYTVESRQPVIIALISDSGDADMYASSTSKNSHPSPEDYDYTSASCGLDVIVLGTTKEQSKMTIGVYGHVRYDETVYRLYVISPSEEDIKRYQIWDWDPDSNSLKLSVDMDLFQFSCDHTLHRLLDDLVESGVDVGVASLGPKSGLWSLDTITKLLELSIWDWDPESDSKKLLIDIDPLYFANDPSLNLLIDRLTLDEGGVASTGTRGAGQESLVETFVHWTGIVLVKLIEIIVEILL